MKALRCDFCGAGLIMDKSREFATCEFCGTKYMKETIQDKIQEIRGQVTVAGAVETYTGDKEISRKTDNADSLFELGKVDEAQKLYQQIAIDNPKDYKAWFGIFKTSVSYLMQGYSNEYIGGNLSHFVPKLDEIPTAIDSALETALELCEDKTEIHKYFDSLIGHYGLSIRTVKASAFQKPDSAVNFYYANGAEFVPNTIDAYTKWLLFSADKTAKIINYSYFDNFRRNITEKYINECKRSNILPFYKKELRRPLYFINPHTRNEMLATSLKPKELHTYLRANKFPERIEKPNKIRISLLRLGNEYAGYKDFSVAENFYKWYHIMTFKGTEVLILS